MYGNMPGVAACSFTMQTHNLLRRKAGLLACLILCACTAHVTAADVTPPVIVAVTPPQNATVSNLTQITVVFSEPVQNVYAEDLLINGLPALSLTGSNDTYTFSFSQPGYGTVLITWDAGQGISDLADPPNPFNSTAPGATWQYTLVDLEPPAILNLSPPAGVTVRRLDQIEVTFSEPVAGVDAADLLINGQPASGVQTLGPGRYRFSFTQPSNGLVNVTWSASHGIRDLAASPNNFGGGSWAYTLDPTAGLATLRINEFLAANISTNLPDENNDAEDWIEIYNYGTNSVNLAGYSLTDESRDPGRWIFPATNIGPGQYLIVYASGKDRRPTNGAPLHANFKLNAFGGYLGLYNAESPRAVVDELAPKYPEQRNDYSYGLDTNGVWKYFRTPTPRAPNGGSAIVGVLEKPHLNVKRGLFSSPFTLIVTPPMAGTTIRYTTNGSVPTETSSLIYNGPLQITNTTVFRVAAFASNWLPSRVETHTYVFLNQVLKQPPNPPGYPTGTNAWTQYYAADYEMDPEIVTNSVYGQMMLPALRSLPALCVSMSIDDFLGPANGIYNHPEPPADQRYLWERPCSAEFILTNGQTGFQIDCGIRIQGNASRTPQKTPKHPFRLLFKSKYGEGSLNYPLYEDSPVTSFETIVLRSDFNNSWVHWDAGQRTRGTKIRDAWTKDAAREMGMVSGHSRPFHLYINGLYWGVYDFGERIDAAFAASYLGGEPEDYDAIASKPTEAIDGNLAAYIAMTNTAGLPMSVLANYDLLKTKLDMTHFIDYTILNFYGANQDWGADGNWNAVRRRDTNGLFKYITWDGEQLIVNTNDNRVTSTDLPSNLHPKLINSPEYRMEFADRVHKHLFNGGALTVERNIARWNKWAAMLDPAIVAESARWGDFRRDMHQYQNGPYLLYTRNDFWIPEVNRMVTNYFPQRHAIFLNQLRSAGLYPSVAAPSFNQHGGRVAKGFNLIITNNQGGGTIYYTTNGVDPRVYGTGAVSPDALVYSGPVTLNASAVVKARYYSGSVWSALNEAAFVIEELGLPLRFTEIMYNPPEGDAYEFIEIMNTGATPVDLSGLGLSGVKHSFSVGRVLAPGEVIVLASDISSNAFAAKYPGVRVEGYFGGSLDNGGELLAIVDKRVVPEAIITAVRYDDEGFWPAAADGAGYSLEVINPRGDPNDPANWRAGAVIGGTPGTVTSFAAPAIRFSEIMAANVTAVTNYGTTPDWIELYNPNAQDVNLEGWSLSDNSNPRRFVFPAGAFIPANGYLVVWCDSATTPGLHAGFGLDQTGETIFLYDAQTNRVDGISFGMQLPDYSLAMLNGEWKLGLPTPGAVNQAAPVANYTNLVINEWLANSAPGQSDWIELFNTSTNLPVALNGFYLANSNTIFRINALSFIPAAGYALFYADEQPGVAHLNFKLHASGDIISLYDPAGVLLNSVNVSYLAEGVSQGRYPDGSDTVVTFVATPSPGAANYVGTPPGPIINEFMAINRRSVLNPFGSYSDWVELYNPNPFPIDMSGMKLMDDSSASSAWSFPSGVVIESNGYLVVWFDKDRPATLLAGGPLNTGRGLSGAGGEIRLLDQFGRILDSVTYGFQVPDMSLGRSSGDWRLMAAPTPGTTNSSPATTGNPANLRINEWMANPASGNDWVELFNPQMLPVDLSGLIMANSPALTELEQPGIAPLSFIGPLGFVQFQADGDRRQGSDHLAFRLDGLGESLLLYRPTGELIDAVYFGGMADNVSLGRLGDGSSVITNFAPATPGGVNYIPITNIVFNEILAKPSASMEQAIELANVGQTPVTIGGWFLSDDPARPMKFQIPSGSVILPGQYFVIYEYQFNGGPGSLIPFRLDGGSGGELWLSEADSMGNLTGRRATVQYGPSPAGTSQGRFPVAAGMAWGYLEQPTFGLVNPQSVTEFRLGTGAFNSPATVGPVVISEIMFQPPDYWGGLGEFVEIYNSSTNSIALHDEAHPTNVWRLRGGVDFEFPAGFTIGPREYVVVVDFDPATDFAMLNAFRLIYNLDSSVRVLGPYRGSLDNSGERLELRKPLPPEPSGLVAYATVDMVEYLPSTPWPTGADGGGLSLQRRHPALYGNYFLHWKADGPTPGRANVTGSQPLEIVSPPQQLTVSKHGQAVFTVAAVGTGDLHYQWRFNEQVLPGETNIVFVLSDVLPVNAGYYDVIVTDDNGSVISPAGQLTVLVPPLLILSQPMSVTITNGSNATFSVTATGDGALSYQWQFNGVDLPGQTNTTLAITNAQLSNAGPYVVVVSDENSSISSEPAILTVLYRATLVQGPQSMILPAGSTAVLTASAYGSFPISYRWRKNGGTYTNAIVNSFTNSLIFTNLAATNAGKYEVVVTNQATTGLGSLSPAAYLSVVTNLPMHQSVNLGDSATFSVGLAYFSALSPAPSYQWRFNGVPLSGKTNTTLVLTNIGMEHLGDYTVDISAGGASYSTPPASLRLLGPTTLTVGKIGSGSAIELQFSGNLGRSYAIESSSNLLDWTEMTVVLHSNAPQTYLFSPSNALPELFFRLKLK